MALNVWLGIWTAKLERERRMKYRERMEECDERIGEVMNELGKAKYRLNEAQSATAALRRSFEDTVKEYETQLAALLKNRDSVDVPEKPRPPRKKRAQRPAEH